MDRRIGTVTIIVTNRTSQAQKVNQILCDYGEIGALTGKLGALPGVSVKSSLTKI